MTKTFNGLGLHLGNLSRLSKAETRSLSAENPTGATKAIILTLLLTACATLASGQDATPMLRVATLPTQTAIASDPSLSSIMGIAESAAGPTKDPFIPGLETSYRYVQFTFRPRGSLELNIQKNLFATVVFARHVSDSSPPTNFATIQIDPVNGGVQVYRP